MRYCWLRARLFPPSTMVSFFTNVPLSKTFTFSVSANGAADSASARKFLEAAEATEDKMVFFNVYSFFEERNQRLRGGPGFSPSDQCEHFVRKHSDMFSAV